MIELYPPGDTERLGDLFDEHVPDRPRLYAVLEGRAPGRVLADQRTDPRCCIARESWFGRVFFSAGTTTEEAVAGIERPEGQVVIDADDPACSGIVRDTATCDERLEFCRPLLGSTEVGQLLMIRPVSCEILPIDIEAFKSCEWRDWLLRVFGSAERYIAESAGFGLFEDGILRSEAHAFFWGRGLVEIGVVTHSDFRGRGYASVAAAHLVAECERRGYTTYWGCDRSNGASAAVAARLGYGSPREYRIAVVS
jgi:GNAT superfamily N-acetyltransferase